MKTYSIKTDFIFKGEVVISATNKKEAKKLIEQLFNAEITILTDNTDQRMQQIKNYSFSLKADSCKLN